MARETIKYEIDPHNRLIIKQTGKKADLHKFRKVLSGSFKLDKDNNLTYLVRAPASKDKNIPHQVRLKGNWSLDNNHDLIYTLNKWGRQTFGDKLTLKGKIEDVDKDSLGFSVTAYDKENTQSKYVIKLVGIWSADENNRLSFKVRKEKGRYDILTLKGVWEIDKHNRIIYRYEKPHRTLTFKGYWDIRDKKRIAYCLDKRAGSEFSFKASFAQFEKNYIKYRVGIEAGNKNKIVERTITLFGKWKIKKGLGLIFEVEYEDKRVKAISFAAEAKLTKNDTISFKLKDERNKNLGGEVKLSHKILEGDGEGFVLFLKSKKEKAVLIGAGFKW